MRCRPALRLAILACIVAGCSSGRKTIERSPIEPSTAHATATTAPSPVSGLLEQLSHPLSGISKVEWNRLFSRMRSPVDRDRFSVERREALLNDSARLAWSRGDEAELLFIETIVQRGGMSGVYDRAGLIHSSNGKVDRQGFKDLLWVDDDGRWARLVDLSRQMLDSADPVGPDKRIYDYTEAIVISYFDGRRWRSGSWFWLLTRAEMAGAEHPEFRPSEAAVSVKLVRAINECLVGKRDRFAEHYDGR